MSIDTKERSEIASTRKRLLQSGVGEVCSGFMPFNDEYNLYWIASLQEPLIIRLYPKEEDITETIDNYYLASDYWFIIYIFNLWEQNHDYKRFVKDFTLKDYVAVAHIAKDIEKQLEFITYLHSGKKKK